MTYPLISEYVRAMQDPAGNLDQLAHLVPVLDDHGEPMRSSGAFAVVFKMKDESTGKEYAIKCFTEEQEGRAEAYRQIADELESVDSTYVTSVKYLEKELFVDCDGDDHEFPVLLMDWIDGETMDRYIAENLYDNYAMSMLCYRFCKMAAWLRSQPFAHGDIKPDNIMVRPDGTLTLIDYDGMFVPSMKGQTSPTIGTKDFSHPLRTKEDFDETIDDFALATIALSLKAISLSPSLFDEYASADRLLFSADDYRDLSQSKALTALKPLMKDSEINTLLYIFLLAYATKTLAMASFRLFSVSKPEYVPIEISTEVTEDDLAEAIEDEYGVKYSKDGKRLLEAPQNIKGEYCIRKDTICICDYAFEHCYLSAIVIPGTVTKIGKSVFTRCFHLTNIEIPNSVTDIGDDTFCECFGLTSIVIPNSINEIREGIFSGCSGLTGIIIPDSVKEIGSRAFEGCYKMKDAAIPNSVTKIGESAFSECTSLTNMKIPNSVTFIGDYAFYRCLDLSNIEIPDSVIKIGKYAFRGCSGLRNIIIPAGVVEIGDGVFVGCSLNSILVSQDNRAFTSVNNCCLSKDLKVLQFGCRTSVIPDSVTKIKNGAFWESYSSIGIKIPAGVSEIGDDAFRKCWLVRIEIPSGVTRISKNTFCDCICLTNVVIPNGVTEIGEGSFGGCSSLVSIQIPESVTRIGKNAFRGCTRLTSVVIPDCVTEIEEGTFCGCSSLASIRIPESVTRIGKNAFRGCTHLTSVVIPDGVTKIEELSFLNCSSLTNIVISNSVRIIEEYAFSGCIRLTSIVIPASVTEIEFGAFYVNNIPENIKAKIIAKFGDKVFGNEYAWINLSLK